jgi:hypothetical protein
MSETLDSTLDPVLQDNLETPRRYLGIRLAQSAGLVDDALDMLDFAREKERDVWRMTKKVLIGEEGEQQEPEMGGRRTIIVGDVTISADQSSRRGQQPKPSAESPTPPAPTPTPTPAPAPSVIEKIKEVVADTPAWKKALVVGGLVGGPIAGVLTGYALAPDAPETPAPVIQQVDPNEFDIDVMPGIETKQ